MRKTYFLIDEYTWDIFEEKAKENGGVDKCLNEALDYFLEKANRNHFIEVRIHRRKRKRIGVYICRGIYEGFKRATTVSPSLVFQSMIQTYLRDIHKINI